MKTGSDQRVAPANGTSLWDQVFLYTFVKRSGYHVFVAFQYILFQVYELGGVEVLMKIAHAVQPGSQKN